MKAGEFFRAAEARRMFPEEKALIERAQLAVTKAADELSVAEATKAAKASRAARELEADKAVEAARAARAAQSAGAAK